MEYVLSCIALVLTGAWLDTVESKAPDHSLLGLAVAVLALKDMVL